MNASAKTVPVLYIRVLLGLVFLFGIAGFLTSSYREERQTRASLHFETGKSLAQEGRAPEAIEEYRAALSLARGDTEYQLALALALLNEGNLNEAERHLQELLIADPTDAIPNWAMARIADRRDDVSSAETYYHRAMYGFWPGDAEIDRLQAHLELVDMLARTSAQSRLLAELLLLVNELPGDPVTRKRVARLFLLADSPSYAKEIFSDLVQQDRQDWDAYAGLGDAEFDLGNYISARTAYRNANRLNPDDVATQARLDLANRIYGLDPTLRGLSSSERHRRSVELVLGALVKVEPCRPPELPLLFPETAQETIDSARVVVSQTRRPRNFADAAEENLSLALALWQAGMELCPPGGEPDVVDRVLAKLAQQQSS